MNIAEVRKRFINYFIASGYKMVPPASLIPENDPSVLFTTAGMQQFKPYYSDPESAPAAAVATVQPVIRTSDIAEVGDDTHLTMFEMLGNFRFGGKDSRALKEQAISEAWQLINEVFEVNKERVYVTVFGGDEQTPEDKESAEIWRELGVEVRKANREENFWGPTGEEGPCGPNTEIYVDGIEVWNLVFNQYYQDREKNFTLLEYQGLDTGSGLERLVATLLGVSSVWEVSPYKEWVAELEPEKELESRVIVDHLRAAVFLISAGVVPANKGREYVLRRLVRKAVFMSQKITGGVNWERLIKNIRDFYAEEYELSSQSELMAVFTKEKEQFEKNLSKASSYLERWLSDQTKRDEKQITELAFYLYESFGFPKELVIEHLINLGWSVDQEHFAHLFKQHQEKSRAGLAGQFKGGLADHEEKTIKHHTAHHLLLAALRQVLGESVVQRGSNVTQERLRIDFSFNRKLTEDELKQVEQIVNEKIQADIPVVKEEMSKDQALSCGALAEFGQKYGDTVSVYTIGDFSKELCGGPHIERTGQLGRFEILKEEASSQGVRRIKARVS